MPTVLMTSGYLPPVLEAVRERFNVIDITHQGQALAYLRSASQMPDAMAIGRVNAHSSDPPTDLLAGQMLEEVLKRDPMMPVVISTAYSSPSTIVDLVKRGAFDYVIEPRNRSEPEAVDRYRHDLLHALTRAVAWRAVVRENEQLKQDLIRQGMPVSIQARSPSMLEVMDLVRKVAPTPATVLITGESGTGKELIAHAIHALGSGRDKPFTAINCGAVSESLLPSELFGHVRGAFTGADADRPGLIREAGSGTLLLDEISTVPPAFQVMLLRVLEQRTARPVGGSGEYPVNCRFIAAANENLDHLVSQGRFRQDLFYRLNTFHIHLPPLRDRRGDIPVLAHHFLRQIVQQYDKPITGIVPSAMNLLEIYAWPGNIRQLRNTIERAVIVCEHDHIGVHDLDPQLRQSAGETDLLTPAGSYREALQDFERRLLQRALETAAGNLSRAARSLNMKRSTLSYRVQQLGLRS